MFYVDSKLFLLRIWDFFLNELIENLCHPITMSVNVIVIVLFLTTIGIIVHPTFAQQFEEPDYTIRRGEVLGFEIDPETTSLIISIKPRTSGELTITLPRDLIDAKIGSEDIDFLVVLNNLEYRVIEETITSSDRTITISFQGFNDEITIIGTQVFSQRAPLSTVTLQQQMDDKIKTELQSEIPEGKAKLLIFSDTTWSGALQATGFDYTEINGQRDRTIIFGCEPSLIRAGNFAAKFQKMTEDGYLKIVAIQNQRIMAQRSTDAQTGEVFIDGNCISSVSTGPGGGGCLIATATFGTELSPQVQQLRELRDNNLLQTESGSAFMTGFNQLYYVFSPTIADWERENRVFKEAVKLIITPMMASLSLLNYVNMDSEAEVLGYGISLILLNVGMYVVAPVGIGLFVVSRKSE